MLNTMETEENCSKMAVRLALSSHQVFGRRVQKDLEKYDINSVHVTAFVSYNPLHNRGKAPNLWKRRVALLCLIGSCLLLRV